MGPHRFLKIVHKLQSTFTRNHTSGTKKDITKQSIMMLLPATDALKRCKERDAPELSADPVQFDMGALYDQAMALDMPPLTLRVWPVIYFDSSLNKKATECATSIGSPMDFKGTIET